MMEWVSANAAVLQVAVAGVSVLVWLVYLQVFLMSYRRQSRPEILINRGAGVGIEARCFIANLGLEPIYVSQILIRLETPDGPIDAAITDREKMSDEQKRDPLQATNQGPLKSGDSFDAGSFGELVARGRRVGNLGEDVAIRGLEVTVVAIHAASAVFIGASRRYDVISRENAVELQPDALGTRQLRGFLARRRLRGKLQRDLSWYRS